MDLRRTPPGPAEAYDPAHDLLGWMEENLRQYGDVFKGSIYGGNVYVLNTPEYAEHVLLRNWENYIRKGQAVKRIALSLGNGLISSNGKFWVSQRRMIQPAFNRNAINELGTVMRAANLALRERWNRSAERGGTVDVTRDVSFLTLEITLRAIFGDDYERIAADFEIVAEESRDIGFATQCTALSTVILAVAGERRAASRVSGDILGMLMQARDRENGRPMPDPQLAREILTIIVAGHETTASVLNWLWYLLARHPDVQSRVAAELEPLLDEEFPQVSEFPKFRLVRAVIEEALRLYPPLWLITRKAVKDDAIGDYFVPSGTEIYLSPYLIQRHPALWSLADEFDPDRFLVGNQEPHHELATCPFGAGPRNCIGEYMARLELQTHLMVMAQGLELQRAEQKPAEKVAGTNLLSRDHFTMTPRPRNTASPVAS
jgi:cytochrome P450